MAEHMLSRKRIVVFMDSESNNISVGVLERSKNCSFPSSLITIYKFDKMVQPRLERVISPDFSLELTGFFPGKHLIHFLVLKMKDFRNFVLHNCILDFDAEQVYLKTQVTNLKNKKVTANPKLQTLEKNWVFKNPKP